jgi:hypothetical protein
LTTVIVWAAGAAGVLVEVESDPEPVSDSDSLSPVLVDCELCAVLVAALCDDVVCGADDEDDELPLSSPPRSTTKTIRRTARPPRTIPARWTPDSPRPGSSPPAGGGFSGVLMVRSRVRGGPEARPVQVRRVTAAGATRRGSWPS